MKQSVTDKNFHLQVATKNGPRMMCGHAHRPKAGDREPINAQLRRGITVKALLRVSVCLALALPGAGLAQERVGDFALIDHQGVHHHMTWYDDHAAVVLLVQANGASEVKAALPGLVSLAATHPTVKVMLLNPGLTDDRAAVAADAAALGHNLPVLMDDTQLVSESLGVTRVGEAVIYNPQTFEIVYRGAAEGLDAALGQFLAGQPVASMPAASGTPIAFPTLAKHQSQAPSYSREVAPIIAENCAVCHRADGIAPFALDSHLAAKGWSPMIREVLLTKRMPPGQIDNKVGHRVKNEMNLSDAELQTLVHWIDAGSPVDGDADPLASLTWPSTKWSQGEPDLIVKVPPQTVPATGIIDYRDIPVDLGLDRDVWVRGSEVVPGDPTVLHHIITTVVPPEGLPNPRDVLIGMIDQLPAERAQQIRTSLFAAAASGKRPNMNEILEMMGPDVNVSALIGGGSTDPDLASVAGYAPGTSVNLYPEGVGGLLRAGTSLSLQMHYTTSGRETVDATEIGIYFYPEGEVPRERMAGGVGNDFSINIPAQAKDHEMQITTVIPQEAYIHTLMPHMHFRGKRMKFTAVYPDGSEELLLSVPNYSFNWQLTHELAEPVKVPAGTHIIATGAFDNSSQNPFNPDPDANVMWGEQSWEEMFMGFYNWKYVDQGGE